MSFRVWGPWSTVMLGVAACVGTSPSVPEGDGGGGDGVDAGNMPSNDAALPGEVDAEVDAGGGSACSTSRCIDDVRLSRCEEGRALTVTCGTSCVQDAQGARCRSFEPTGPATRGDLDPTGLRALRLDGAVLDVSSGQITRGGQVLRPANVSPTSFLEEIIEGIGFRRTEGPNGVAVLRARSIEVVGLTTEAPYPLVMVAADDIRITGAWRVTCGTLGGGAGGATAFDAPGPLGGKSYEGQGEGVAIFDELSGAGGGANVGSGGAGGVARNDGFDQSGDGGQGAVADFGRLRGGGGGGGGLRLPSNSVATSVGGSGGGAVQLVAGVRIDIGHDGTNDVVGINVGGCGAAGGVNGSQQPIPQVAGAGGGGGGALILEAPLVRGAANAGIAANGGGGGSGRIGGGPVPPGRGEDGKLSNEAATGGGGGNCSAGGGAGAAGLEVSGRIGTSETACAAFNGGKMHAGGGGGGAGYMAIRTLSGTANLAEGFLISPNLPATFNQSRLDDVR